MRERWLYCEGQSDAPVLKAVFSALGYDVIAESTGGNPAEIARWQRENGAVAASISDRDYRSREDCDASYDNDSVKFLWRRHSIENYLLEPEVVSTAIERIKRSLQAMPRPPACTEALPENDIDAINNQLIEAAKRIVHKECGCVCIHSLWVDLRESLGRVQQRLFALLTSGNNATQDECVTALKTEAGRLISAAADGSNAVELTDSEIVRRYADQMTRLNQDSYWHDLTFLHEFHGKRLLRELRQGLDESYGFQSSKILFLQELTNAIDVIAVATPHAEYLKDFRELGESVLALNAT